MEIKTYKDGRATVYEYWSEEDHMKPVPCPTYRCYRYEPQKEPADKTEKDVFDEMVRKFEEIGNIRFSGFTKPLIALEDVISVIHSISEQYKKESCGNDWIPVSSGCYPDDMEEVRVTFAGYNDGKPHYEAFAYRYKGKWYWSDDNNSVKAVITAWKKKENTYSGKESS